MCFFFVPNSPLFPKTKKKHKKNTMEITQSVEPNPNNVPWCYHTTASSGKLGLIVTDLDYVHETYSSSDTCDLWEVCFVLFFFVSFFVFVCVQSHKRHTEPNFKKKD